MLYFQAVALLGWSSLTEVQVGVATSVLFGLIVMQWRLEQSKYVVPDMQRLSDIDLLLIQGSVYMHRE